VINYVGLSDYWQLTRTPRQMIGSPRFFDAD